jgi:FMN reductase
MAPSPSPTPSPLSVAVVVGNPKPQSRTMSVATSLVRHLFGDRDVTLTTVDLADHVDAVFSWPSAHLDGIAAQVAASDIAVFASPTYKATYTGLLKAFLDRYPSNGLAGLVAIPLHTGGDLTHSMGPSVNLAPLLVELGAIVPGRGFYFVTSQMNRMEDVVADAAATYRMNIERVAKISRFASAPIEARV